MSTSQQRKILLVEENPDLRTATADLLSTLGYRTLVTSTAEEAVEAARLEPVDLMIANAYPSQGTGLSAVDRVRAAVPGLPALLVSGFGDDLELRHRVVSGDVGFLPIPFSAESLAAAVEETLATKPAAGLGELGPPSSALPAAGGRAARSRPWLAAAAVVVLAAGLALQLRERPPEMPAPELGDPRRGHEIELLEPIGEVEALPEALAWREVPGSARYRVVLTAVDDTEIWKAETRQTSTALPAEVVDRLHPAVFYYWQVEGYAEDSSRTGRSNLMAFRLAPRGPA